MHRNATGVRWNKAVSERNSRYAKDVGTVLLKKKLLTWTKGSMCDLESHSYRLPACSFTILIKLQKSIRFTRLNGKLLHFTWWINCLQANHVHLWYKLLSTMLCVSCPEKWKSWIMRCCDYKYTPTGGTIVRFCSWKQVIFCTSTSLSFLLLYHQDLANIITYLQNSMRGIKTSPSPQIPFSCL